MSWSFGEAKPGRGVVPVSYAGLGIASAPFRGPSLKVPGCVTALGQTPGQAKHCVKQCLKPGQNLH